MSTSDIENSHLPGATPANSTETAFRRRYLAIRNKRYVARNLMGKIYCLVCVEPARQI